ncbi:ABC-type dipeptide transport system, periplasmic component [Xenococcus sp. PCC 7305]|uniref:peptide ABC transporter substrate-binding protein n=1 Tax=Xenococcus sp. PCC 7305 TaxID=102125 RepID=UPI0002ABFD69|nr:peptide ABC transporter substrate-binding protein [Xenococcus sp. PCC 7305]ELS05426.1 ABC-type dipeptide transport system, periplasmic component [Xenococcus sp. PCC 7305]
MKKILSLGLSCLLASTITACSDRTSQTNKNTNSLKLLYWQAPTILNPHLSTGFKDSEASRITLEPLASFNNDGELIPFLAAEIPSVENGGVAADGKSVTWKLKQNIKWSDGQPFTAKDVIFTYEFVTNPQVAAVSGGIYEVVSSIEAIDDYTIKVNFQDVNPAWYLVFVGAEGMILPQHIYQNYNGANSREAPANLQPVGTGAYRVVEFKPGDTVIYEANPEFRAAEKLGFTQVELKGGGDATSAARAVLQTSDADFAYNLQVEAQLLQELESAGQGKVVSNFGALMERLVINHTDPNRATEDGERSSVEFPHPFFSDRKVRQALTFAIDRETIAQQLYGVTGQATANFLVAPQQYVSTNTSYEYNPELATQLLDEAGWQDTNGNGTRDKNGVEMSIVFQTSVNPLRQKTQAIIKRDLQALGIEVELKSIDASVYFSSDPSSEDTVERFYADLQMYTTGNTNPDPGTYMQFYLCESVPQKSNGWQGNNRARYCNEKYDALWRQANKELDSKQREQLFIEMNDLLVNEAVVIPLVHRANVTAFSNDVTGYELTPWDMRTWDIMNWQRIKE